VPSDRAVATVEVNAPLADVLATLRDVEHHVNWIPAIKEAKVLTVEDGTGLPATAHFKASATVGTDEYTLSYEHTDDTMAWSMVQGKLQTGQEGLWTLEDVGDGRTRATYDLMIHHNLPLPGFVRRRVIQGLVDDTVNGLVERMASSYS